LEGHVLVGKGLVVVVVAAREDITIWFGDVLIYVKSGLVVQLVLLGQLVLLVADGRQAEYLLMVMLGLLVSL